MTGNGGTSGGHGVWQSVTMTSRSIGVVFRSMNQRRPTPMSVPPPPYELDLRRREDRLHAVDGGVAAGDDDVGAVSELARQPTELGDGPCQLRVLHRAGGVDEEPGRGRGW